MQNDLPCKIITHTHTHTHTAGEWLAQKSLRDMFPFRHGVETSNGPEWLLVVLPIYVRVTHCATGAVFDNYFSVRCGDMTVF